MTEIEGGFEMSMPEERKDMEETKDGPEGKTLLDAIEGIRGMIDEQNGKIDAKGFSEDWAKCHGALREWLERGVESQRFRRRRYSLHMTDEEPLDSYFIFGRGMNGILEFRIRELPGWRFGLWMGDVKEADRRDGDCDGMRRKECEADFFWQHEDNVYKFKPSRSEFACQLGFRGKDGAWHVADDHGAGWLLAFTKDEPSLSYFRDMTGTDFNEAHVTRLEAWRSKASNRYRLGLRKALTRSMDAAMRRLSRRLGARLEIMEGVSPRYWLSARSERQAPMLEEGARRAVKRRQAAARLLGMPEESAYFLEWDFEARVALP